LDLIRQADVEKFFAEEKPEYIFLAAVRVGGIYANSTYKADFIYQNIQVQNNVIHQSYVHGVKKLLFLGSSCIYPKHCPQPMKEEYLLTGELEPTNDAYAIGKIAGIKMCQSYNQQYETNFISVMPTNLYGPYDNFDLKNAHILPTMLRKFHEAKGNGHTPVELWGSGTPRREFVYSDDMADACLHVMGKINTFLVFNLRR
jgi:GDP-L-fucose synthase